MSGEAICERYRDAWGAKAALVLALLATLACIAFASPWLVVPHAVEIVMAIQLGTGLVIAMLAAHARRRRLALRTIIADAIVLWSALAAAAIAIYYAFTHYGTQVQVVVYVVALLVAGGLASLRLRGRGATPGPITLVTWYVVEGTVVALPLTRAMIEIERLLHPQLVKLPVIGAAYALGAGLCLAVPMLLSLLVYWPASRREARDWEHLRRAR